jgi:hypothetical protein
LGVSGQLKINSLVLVTATQSGNVMYAYHTRGGLTTYSWSVRTFTWSGSQVAYSCASNNDGYFSILYYNQYEKDTGVGTSRLESKRCYYANLGSTLLTYWNTLKVAGASSGETIDPNACIEDGIYPTHNPDHGGVWA